MTCSRLTPFRCNLLAIALMAGCLPWGKATSCEPQVWFSDQDGDGFGRTEGSVSACERPDGFVTDATDCDDEESTISPTESEFCDLTDNNCDGLVDEDATDASAWYADADDDGYGDSTVYLVSCQPEEGYVVDSADCDDGDAGVAPGEPELCGDGVDQDCTGDADEPYSTCTGSLLDCSEDVFECLTADNRSSTCMCGCAGDERLMWEIEGIFGDSYSSSLLGATFQFETASGTSDWVTCPDELLDLPEDILPHVLEVNDLTIHIVMPCDDEFGALGQWYKNYYDGKYDRRSGSIIYKKYDEDESDREDFSTWPEEFRWNFYEALLIEYSPMAPCSTTSELTIYAEKAEPA